MSNVFDIKNINNSTTKSSFDLSERTLFTAKVGELTPFMSRLIMPGDHIKINTSHFTRTVEVNSAAYATLNEQVNYFFVPFHLLHKNFDTFLVQMKDNAQSAGNIFTPLYTNSESPYISSRSLVEFLQGCQDKKLVDELGYPVAPRIANMLSYLGYDNFMQYVVNYPEEIYNHEFDGGIPSPDNPNRPNLGLFVNRKNAEDMADVRLNPFPLLAFQKVYYDYFRYDQWEKNSANSFNIDYAEFGQPLDIDILDSQQYINRCMFTPHYVNYKKDYFFGVIPRSQFGDEATVPIEYNPVTSTSPNVPVTNNQVNKLSLSSFISSIIKNPSILAWRKAKALQKLKEIQISNEQDYKSQIEAIFGVSMSDDKSQMCRWLGGYNQDIQISEVVNSNLTDGSGADIKGKGIGNGSGYIDETFNDFGILIGTYTCVPRLYYDIPAGRPESYMVHVDDYPNPVMDKIGNEAIPVRNVFGCQGFGNQHIINSTFGFAPRYYQFKSSYDRVLGGFSNFNFNTYKSWTSPLRLSSMIERLGIDMNQTVFELNYSIFKVNPNVVNPIFNVQVNSLKDLRKFFDDDTSYQAYLNEIEFKIMQPSITDQLLISMDVRFPIVRRLDYNGLPY